MSTDNDDQTASGTPEKGSSPRDGGEDSFGDVFTGNLPAELPAEVDLAADDWENAPTRAFSLLDAAPAARPGDPAFLLTRADEEPDTIFDEDARRKSHTHREMKIAREGDGRRLTEGHVINERFEIRRSLGAGRVGTVYLVDDLRLKDKKALKLMHPTLIDSEAASRRFISEIKTLQGLSHEHIVRIYDFGLTEPGGLSFFTMEYVDGISLAQLLKKKGGRLPLDKSIGLITQILDTLEYAHQHGTHRHLTPVNIMVRATGRIALLNFGLSTTHSSSGLTVDTAAPDLDYYKAPEQRENPGSADARSDLYAAGAILYQMLTGEIPLDEPLPPSRLHKGLPRKLDRVIMRCLAADPAERFTNARELADALNTALRPSISPALWVLIVILGLAAAGATTFFFLSR